MFDWNLFFQAMESIAVAGGIGTFLVQYRRSQKDQGFAAYLHSSLEYMNLEKLKMEHTELMAIYSNYEDYRALDPAGKKIRQWYYALFTVFETIYLAKAKKWIGKDEWSGWEVYLVNLITNARYFREAWEDGRTMYSTRFREYVDKVISEHEMKDGKTSSTHISPIGIAYSGTANLES